MVTARYVLVRIRTAFESAGYVASVFVRTLVDGTTAQRMNVSQAFPASASLIVAPAVEYNWSGKAGVIVGDGSSRLDETRRQHLRRWRQSIWCTSRHPKNRPHRAS